MSTLNEITAELKRKGFTKDAREIEKVIADSDDIIQIYFDLDFQEEYYDEDESTLDVQELESTAYNKAIKLFDPLSVGGVTDEGHDENTLVCKFRVKKSDLPKLNDLIGGEDTTMGDGYFEISDYFVAQNFQIMEADKQIDFEDWDEYIEDMGSSE